MRDDYISQVRWCEYNGFFILSNLHYRIDLVSQTGIGFLERKSVIDQSFATRNNVFSLICWLIIEI